MNKEEKAKRIHNLMQLIRINKTLIESYEEELKELMKNE